MIANRSQEDRTEHRGIIQRLERLEAGLVADLQRRVERMANAVDIK